MLRRLGNDGDDVVSVTMMSSHVTQIHHRWVDAEHVRGP